MKQPVYNIPAPGSKPVIACFISGSGTNYQRIVEKNPNFEYIVFTNRPGCEGIARANQLGHRVITLSHLPFLSAVRQNHGSGIVPRNCPERVRFEQQVSALLEQAAGKRPDLICLAGYDQWVTDWLVERYYPRILNVHPGDTARGYDGLGWIPTAKAIIAGDKYLKSTLFIVDKGEDTGPVLLQSGPLDIIGNLQQMGDRDKTGLLSAYRKIIRFNRKRSINTYQQFRELAGSSEKETLKVICQHLQNALKVMGDWVIYPYGVHGLIIPGRVELEGRQLFVDGSPLDSTGYHPQADDI